MTSDPQEYLGHESESEFEDSVIKSGNHVPLVEDLVSLNYTFEFILKLTCDRYPFVEAFAVASKYRAELGISW